MSRLNTDAENGTIEYCDGLMHKTMELYLQIPGIQDPTELVARIERNNVRATACVYRERVHGGVSYVPTL